jgi:serine/threonine protein kinase
MTGRFPRQFGKYVLLKPLAKGGMGEIYLAAGGEVGGFEKLCVIKKVITEKSDQTKANRFLDEAKVGLRLSHSGLVNTFDVGEVSGEFYIAMELIEGKDLREVWNRCVRTRQRIPLDVALHVVRETARALSYVHDYGDLKLVHRDVAPPNILLAYVGDVKLTDFGLARSVLKQEHTAPGVVFGRAAYLAPEQARGEVADARTDVYTLGIVLWELLTGQQFLQLGGLDPAAALALVRHPRQVPPSARAPWITPVLDQVALKALAPDREKRFQSADELRQALSAVIAEIAPTADSSRVSAFLHGIYAETIVDERSERERFLKTEIPTFRSALARGVRLGGDDATSDTGVSGSTDRGSDEVEGLPGTGAKASADPRAENNIATPVRSTAIPWDDEDTGLKAAPLHLPGMPGSPPRPSGKGEGRRAQRESRRNLGSTANARAVSDSAAGTAASLALAAVPTVEARPSVPVTYRHDPAAQAGTSGAPGAVALVVKGDEKRRKERREAALRVVAELASEETAGPRRLEAALAVAGDRVPMPANAGKAAGDARTRRPTPPPPLPPGASAVRAPGAPAGGKSASSAALVSAPMPPSPSSSPPSPPGARTPAGGVPSPGLELSAGAAGAAIPVASPLPGRPLLGQGMMARYGQEAAADTTPARRGLFWALLAAVAVGAIAAAAKLL